MAVQMQNISVGRYACAESHGWGGWVEPENREWILFVPAETHHKPEFYFRDPTTGAVIDRTRFTSEDMCNGSPLVG
jgi:hypothetical protein